MTSTAPTPSQDLVACIRIPKSGSKSFATLVAAAFEGRGTFYLPDTWRPEARISRWQAFRLWRSQTQNLRSKLGVWSLDDALARIDRDAVAGDLVVGGHFDYGTVSGGMKRPVRSIVMMRDPAERLQSEYAYARVGFLKKKPWQRFDAHLLAKAAGRYDFDGFIDFQRDHAEVYGDVAAGYLGWKGGMSASDVRATVWCWGVLDRAEAFAADLSDRVGRALSFPRSNVTAGKGEEKPTADQRRRIEALSPRDHELYALCRGEAAG